MRSFYRNRYGSAWPIIILVICLGLGSFLVLLLGEINEPMLNFMDSEDDSIDESVSSPRESVSGFLQIFWPRGVLLIVLLGLALAVFMEYQKARYKQER